MKQTVIAICVALIGSTIAHSWIACTDYLQENGELTQKNKLKSQCALVSLECWNKSICRWYRTLAPVHIRTPWLNEYNIINDSDLHYNVFCFQATIGVLGTAELMHDMVTNIRPEIVSSKTSWRRYCSALRATLPYLHQVALMPSRRNALEIEPMASRHFCTLRWRLYHWAFTYLTKCQKNNVKSTTHIGLVIIIT